MGGWFKVDGDSVSGGTFGNGEDSLRMANNRTFIKAKQILTNY
jgi:hypothetical protein